MSASNHGDSVKAILYAFLANLGLAIAKTGAAMVRKERSLTTPRDISSRSGSVSANRERRRKGGRMPPPRH